MPKVKEPTVAYRQNISYQTFRPSTIRKEERLFTYDDFLSFPNPNEGTRYEIINGELFMSPAPKPLHQDIVGNLFFLIKSHVTKHELGKVYFSPIDIVLSFTTIVEPDLIFISNERKHIIVEKNIIEAPDFVVEVLSPSNKKYDEVQKKNLYQQFGVKEYWIVDAEKQTISQFILEGKMYSSANIFSLNEKISSSVIKGLRINVKKIFSF